MYIWCPCSVRFRELDHLQCLESARFVIVLSNNFPCEFDLKMHGGAGRSSKKTKRSIMMSYIFRFLVFGILAEAGKSTSEATCNECLINISNLKSVPRLSVHFGIRCHTNMYNHYYFT